MEELEKCPFCGGEAFINDDGTLEPEFDKTGAHIGTYKQIGDLFWCECKECGATGSEKKSPEEAEEAWNRRCCD